VTQIGPVQCLGGARALGATMKITDAFLGEHGVFYVQFADLEAAGPEADLRCVQRQARLLAAALESHAHLENELLFEVLERKADYPIGMLQVMRSEHEAIERALQEIQSCSESGRARGLLSELIQTARDHFAKEELVAFAFAEERLAEQELIALGWEWAVRRGVRLPGGVATSNAKAGAMQ
jgi:hemerythrin-like domain-containing protein